MNKVHGFRFRSIDNDHKEKENEMFNPKLQMPCMYTCDAHHNHGVGYAQLSWRKDDPLVVSITALNTAGGPLVLIANGVVCDTTFRVARDVLYTAVRSGKSYGCPVVGEGAVTCKILKQQITTLSIRWGAGAIMWVDRDDLSRWIDDSYTVIPASAEDAAIDAAITRILESK